MRGSFSLTAVVFGLAAGLLADASRSQPNRDFVFTDDDGHLIIRFTGAAELDPNQAYEVTNQEFSQMVHDRLHADIQFAMETPDPVWARSMEPRIRAQIEHWNRKHEDRQASEIIVECRAVSCRLIVEQPTRYTVPEHLSVLESVQEALEAFIAERRHDFESGFMITAYDQEFETPHIKVFLRRTASTAAAQATP